MGSSTQSSASLKSGGEGPGRARLGAPGPLSSPGKPLVAGGGALMGRCSEWGVLGEGWGQSAVPPGSGSGSGSSLFESGEHRRLGRQTPSPPMWLLSCVLAACPLPHRAKVRQSPRAFL